MAFSVGLVLEKYWFSIVYIAVCIELVLVAAFSIKILIEKVLKNCFFSGFWQDLGFGGEFFRLKF